MRLPYKHLTYTDRLRIETLHNEGYKPKDIAKVLKVHTSTIYRELKRGLWHKRDSQYRYIPSYSCDLSQTTHEFAISARGVNMKLGNDTAFVDCIEYAIKELGYSPAAALNYIETNRPDIKTKISVPTLYKYIKGGIFYGISSQDLIVCKKRPYKKVIVTDKRQHKRLNGESIEKRDPDILDRKEFGHWEMDTVHGKRRKSACLLVLTERKTRMEIIRKLAACKAQYVVDELLKLQKQWGSMFPSVFKTITVDNGSEFSDYYNMCIDHLQIYYCHPYSSFERGSNENANKLIRRHIPKSTNFDDKTNEDIYKIEEWINYYPRKIFDYECSADRFLKELVRLNE